MYLFPVFDLLLVISSLSQIANSKLLILHSPSALNWKNLDLLTIRLRYDWFYGSLIWIEAIYEIVLIVSLPSPVNLCVPNWLSSLLLWQSKFSLCQVNLLRILNFRAWIWEITGLRAGRMWRWGIPSCFFMVLGTKLPCISSNARNCRCWNRLLTSETSTY